MVCRPCGNSHTIIQFNYWHGFFLLYIIFHIYLFIFWVFFFSLYFYVHKINFKVSIILFLCFHLFELLLFIPFPYMCVYSWFGTICLLEPAHNVMSNIIYIQRNMPFVSFYFNACFLCISCRMIVLLKSKSTKLICLPLRRTWQKLLWSGIHLHLHLVATTINKKKPSAKARAMPCQLQVLCVSFRFILFLVGSNSTLFC